MHNFISHFRQFSKIQWFSLMLCALLVWPDVARALSSYEQQAMTPAQKQGLAEQLRYALEGYKTVYAYQDNSLIFVFHDQVKKMLTEVEIQSQPDLKKFYAQTEIFQSIAQKIQNIAAPELNAYNQGKSDENKLLMEDIQPLQMLLVSIRDNILSNDHFAFGIQDAEFSSNESENKLQVEHDMLYQTFKRMYDAAIGQAMITHAHILSLDIPEDQDIDFWNQEVKKMLTSAYCDTAPEFFKPSNLTPGFEIPNQNHKSKITCYQTAKYVTETLTYRPHFNLDDTIEDMNEGIGETNQAAIKVSQNISRGFGLQKHSEYEQAYLSMFNRTSGVLLLTETLQGRHPYQVSGLMYDKRVDGDIPTFAAIMKNIEGAGRTMYQMSIGLKNAVLEASGHETSYEAMEVEQTQKVNPLFHYNHFLNPQEYKPRPYRAHNTQEINTKENRDRVRAAIAEAIDQTQSGIDDLHEILRDFGKKYERATITPSNSVTGKIIESVNEIVLKSANQDLEEGMQALIAYYPASAMTIANTQPTMVATIIDQMVKTSIAQHKSKRNQQVIGTVMLVAAGVLILTGVGAGIAAGVAGTAAASAGWLMVGKGVLMTGFVMGVSDTIYSGQQSYTLYRDYEKTKAATFIYIKESNPQKIKEIYKEYQVQLVMTILAGAFAVVDISALKNLANIKNWTIQRVGKPITLKNTNFETEKMLSHINPNPSTPNPSKVINRVKQAPESIFNDDLRYFKKEITSQQKVVWNAIVRDYFMQNPRYASDVKFRHAIQKRVIQTHETGHTTLNLGTGAYQPDAEKLAALADQKTYLRSIGYDQPMPSSIVRANGSAYEDVADYITRRLADEDVLITGKVHIQADQYSDYMRPIFYIAPDSYDFGARTINELTGNIVAPIRTEQRWLSWIRSLQDLDTFGASETEALLQSLKINRTPLIHTNMRGVHRGSPEARRAHNQLINSQNQAYRALQSTLTEWVEQSPLVNVNYMMRLLSNLPDHLQPVYIKLLQQINKNRSLDTFLLPYRMVQSAHMYKYFLTLKRKMIFDIQDLKKSLASEIQPIGRDLTKIMHKTRVPQSETFYAGADLHSIKVDKNFKVGNGQEFSEETQFLFDLNQLVDRGNGVYWVNAHPANFWTSTKEYEYYMDLPVVVQLQKNKDGLLSYSKLVTSKNSDQLELLKLNHGIDPTKFNSEEMLAIANLQSLSLPRANLEKIFEKARKLHILAPKRWFAKGENMFNDDLLRKLDLASQNEVITSLLGKNIHVKKYAHVYSTTKTLIESTTSPNQLMDIGKSVEHNVTLVIDHAQYLPTAKNKAVLNHQSLTINDIQIRIMPESGKRHYFVHLLPAP